MGLLLPIHALLVARRNRLVLEQYFEGEDETWGDALGRVQFGPQVLHDLRSVTKSIVGLLYGIALERGLVPALDTPVVDGFPEYPELVVDPERRKVTVAHTLNMTMGMAWDENKPYTDPTNSEIAMELAPDRYRFILDRPIIGAPGEKWVYSGGAVALIGALIERGSGRKLSDFAREALFAPLGITEFYWMAGSDGVASPASGLRLTAPDLLRIGVMLIDGGRCRAGKWCRQPGSRRHGPRQSRPGTGSVMAGSGTATKRRRQATTSRCAGSALSAMAASGSGWPPKPASPASSMPATTTCSTAG